MNIVHKCLSLLWCTETTTTSACVKIMILSSWLHLSWFWDLKKYLNATKQLCDKNTSATVKLRVFVFRSIFLFCHFVFWHNLLFVCFFCFQYLVYQVISNDISIKESSQTTVHTKVIQDAHVCVNLTLHKKWSFPLKISSLNVTKSAGNCGFGHIYWRNP